MSELMNILLNSISKSSFESSLLHSNTNDSSSTVFYMNDIFNDFNDFKS